MGKEGQSPTYTVSHDPQETERSPFLGVRGRGAKIIMESCVDRQACWRLYILGAQKHRPKFVGELGEGRYDYVL